MGQPLPLAVAVAPFLLLATGGLAHARRLGVFGLVLVVVMWAQDTAPVEKSNVRSIAHTIEPSLAPGDLVISTQPETIPLLHYYLPDGLRYATLTGEETDFGVCRTGRTASSGWATNAEPTSRHDRLAEAGTRVVLVEPIVWTLNRWRAPWTKLIRIARRSGRRRSRTTRWRSRRFSRRTSRRRDQANCGRRCT